MIFITIFKIEYKVSYTLRLSLLVTPVKNSGCGPGLGVNVFIQSCIHQFTG
jgi:hypothetical protein